jgi:hypothetical protein
MKANYTANRYKLPITKNLGNHRHEKEPGLLETPTLSTTSALEL